MKVSQVMTVEAIGKQANRFEYLDILRLLCAASVAIFHYLVISPFTKLTSPTLLTAPNTLVYGLFGVEIFFMISGFVITLSAKGRTPGAFLWSRFLRLYPAYWICCILTAVTILTLDTGDHTLWRPHLTTFSVNMTMIAGFVNVPYVDQVYWSLKPELIFYFYVTCLLLLRTQVDSLWVIAGWLLVCAVAPFGPSFIGKLGMTNYAPFFIIGMLVQSMLEPRHRWLKAGLLLVALCFGLNQVTLEALDFSRRGLPAPAPYVAMGVVSLGLVILLCSAFLRAPPRFQASMMKLGAITYPLYLIHNVMGALLTNLLSRFCTPGIALALTMLIVFAVAAAIALIFEPVLRTRLRRIGEALIKHY